MFWKKKNNDELDDNVIDFTYDTDDKREWFRVLVPEDYAALLIPKEDGKSVSLKDISCGGFSCEKCNFKDGEKYNVSIMLPDENKKISADFEVIQIDELNVCHCRFVNLPDKDINKIHRYVLEVQKKRLM